MISQLYRVLGEDAGAALMEHVLPHFFGRKEGEPAPAFGLSNHLIMMLLSALLVFVLFSYVGARSKKTMVPTGLHNLLESILSFLRTQVIRPALGESADRFTPFIWTVFFFILFNNLLGLFPMNEILSLATGKPQHVWGTATANFSVTGGLAIISFIIVHLSGITQQIRIKMDP